MEAILALVELQFVYNAVPEQIVTQLIRVVKSELVGRILQLGLKHAHSENVGLILEQDMEHVQSEVADILARQALHHVHSEMLENLATQTIKIDQIALQVLIQQQVLDHALNDQVVKLVQQDHQIECNEMLENTVVQITETD